MSEGSESIKDALQRIRRHLLSSPVRLAVALLLLARGEMEFNELQRVLGTTPGALWSHIEKMKQCGFIELRRRLSIHGPRLIISLTDRGREELLEYLDALDKLTSIAKRSVPSKTS